jgi:sugar lactone lactonase YvrE
MLRTPVFPLIILFSLVLLLSCFNPVSESKSLKAEKVSDLKAKLGEGSIWDQRKQVLYWVDIEDGLLFEYNPVLNTTISHKAGKKIGTVVPETDNSVILALEDGIYRMFLQNDSLEFISRPSSLLVNQRFNDGKCDPAGRLWVGTMGPYKTGFLYCLNNEGEIKEVLDSITISNGITWSPDSSKMYYVDTRNSKLRQFTFNVNDGSIKDEKVIIEVPDSLGSPDGMTIDSDGKLWIAHWGGYCVYQVDPSTGEILQKIEVPARNITSCAFGGRNLDVLYITTASIGMSGEESKSLPDAGKLFMVRPGAKGIPANYCKLSK